MQNNNDVSALRDTIIPKSDQLNSEQLLGNSITVTVTSVSRGNAEQPVTINYAGDNGRPYKPCKSMRKVLIFAWGDDGRVWVGRSMTLYNDPDVMFGGVKVGGIRISHMSHISSDISISLNATRGKKSQLTVKKIAGQAAENQPVDYTAERNNIENTAKLGTEKLRAAWGALTPACRKALGKPFIDACAAIASAADFPDDEEEISDDLATLNAVTQSVDTTEPVADVALQTATMNKPAEEKPAQTVVVKVSFVNL